ncbi:MAG: dihydroorotate dehydrogenase electron transfer subunit, partial [Bradyrhizobium sp.]
MSLDHSSHQVQAAATPPASSHAPWKPSIVAELAQVVANTAVNAEYRHLVVDCSEVAASAQAGQFFQLLCPHPAGEQPFLRRPMSLYGADPVTRQVEFLYKVTGAGTRGLDLIKPGD